MCAGMRSFGNCHRYSDNQTMIINSVVETSRIDATYNLTVADFETYFVGTNKVLVHNCGADGQAVISKWDDKVKDVSGKRPGERSLKSDDKGSPKANWKENSSKLRKETNTGNPIRDAHVNENGKRLNSGKFLEAERNQLSNSGYKYDEKTTTWKPIQDK